VGLTGMAMAGDEPFAVGLGRGGAVVARAAPGAGFGGAKELCDRFAWTGRFASRLCSVPACGAAARRASATNELSRAAFASPLEMVGGWALPVPLLGFSVTTGSDGLDGTERSLVLEPTRGMRATLSAARGEEVLPCAARRSRSCEGESVRPSAEGP
jgi:hypothetical protein